MESPQNKSLGMDSPQRKTTRIEPNSPSKQIGENNSLNASGDKEKKPEKSKAEAVNKNNKLKITRKQKMALKNETDIARKLLLDGMIQKSLDLTFKSIVEHKEVFKYKTYLLIIYCSKRHWEGKILFICYLVILYWLKHLFVT